MGRLELRTNVAPHSPTRRQHAVIVVLPRATSVFNRSSSPRSPTGAASQLHEEIRPPQHPLRRLLYLLALLLCSSGSLGATTGAPIYANWDSSQHRPPLAAPDFRILPPLQCCTPWDSPVFQRLSDAACTHVRRQRESPTSRILDPPCRTTLPLNINHHDRPPPSTRRQCLERRVAVIGMTNIHHAWKHTNW
jgi:hypothetical protein